jgi:predicted CopG family antitoxin
MKTQEETITISKRVYENLLTNKKELEILYEHGVQSWELYEQSMEILDNDLENK